MYKSALGVLGVAFIALMYGWIKQSNPATYVALVASFVVSVLLILDYLLDRIKRMNRTSRPVTSRPMAARVGTGSAGLRHRLQTSGERLMALGGVVITVGFGELALSSRWPPLPIWAWWLLVASGLSLTILGLLRSERAPWTPRK